MNQFPKIDETLVRRIVLLICFVAFIYVNWGSTIDGLKHVFLSAMTYSFRTLDEDVRQAIVGTLVPFGETMANLMAIGGIWLFSNQFVKVLDLDMKLVGDVTTRLNKQNILLSNRLAATNSQLSRLSESIEEILEHSPALSQFPEQLTGARMELEKLMHKANPKPPNGHKDTKNKSPDLFDAPISKPAAKTKKRRPPRRRKTADPKF